MLLVAIMIASLQELCFLVGTVWRVEVALILMRKWRQLDEQEGETG
jgi:hypothetical protein